VKIRVLWFGRRTGTVLDDEVEVYCQRVRQRWPAEDRVLRAVAGGRNRDPRRALREEAKLLAATVEPSWVTVALDESGGGCTSTTFARRLAELEERSTPGIDFVIGSDLGLDREFVNRAQWRLSLSDMTLPHSLARLMLWEQLFRATHILGGGRYHRSTLQ
jgi:23S rRNA (pseudouridine1915-N3)-methyltransferase